MATDHVEAVVIGSGPNGLAAAVTLARAGVQVVVYEAEDALGGGARTLDLGLTDAGVQHDLCSAVHPLALASPFFEEFDVRARGVEIVAPEISYAQPLTGQPAGVAWRDLDRTVADLPGTEGEDWRRLLGPLVRHDETVIELALSDKRSLPAPFRSRSGLAGAARFARAALSQGTRLWNRALPGTTSAALLTGVGAHAIAPMPSLGSAGTALMLGTALAADLQAHGGAVVTGRRVRSWRELPRARAYLFDTTPRALTEIWAEKMPPRAARTLRKFPYGPGAAKVDFVLSEPVPWKDARLHRAGTVHVGGDRAEMALAEAEVNRGRHARAPMVLASEPAQVVASRQVGRARPLWTYAHVPAGSTRDVTEDVTRQIERFAPGFRDVIVASRAIPAAGLPDHTAHYIGGGTAPGAITPFRILPRPTPWRHPYSQDGRTHDCQ